MTGQLSFRASAASRGIAVVPTESPSASRPDAEPLGQDDGDSSTTALRAFARNDGAGVIPSARSESRTRNRPERGLFGQHNADSSTPI